MLSLLVTQNLSLFLRWQLQNAYAKFLRLCDAISTPLRGPTESDGQALARVKEAFVAFQKQAMEVRAARPDRMSRYVQVGCNTIR